MYLYHSVIDLWFTHFYYCIIRSVIALLLILYMIFAFLLCLFVWRKLDCKVYYRFTLSPNVKILIIKTAKSDVTSPSPIFL